MMRKLRATSDCAGHPHGFERGMTALLEFFRRLRARTRRRRAKLVETVRLLVVQRTVGMAPPGEQPHMTDAVAARFREELARAALYLEYGSGGSTVMADRLGIPTLSVESDRYFARATAKVLSAGTSVRQVAADIGLTRLWGRPVVNSPAKGRLYVNAPFGEAGPFPDFILVDGRYRVACALECARRAFARGTSATLLFDDYQRACYRMAEHYLGPPEPVGDAAIFIIGAREPPAAAIEAAYRDMR
jgi:hypothetical protein